MGTFTRDGITTSTDITPLTERGCRVDTWAPNWSGSRPGGAPPITAPAAWGTCLPPWTWLRGRSPRYLALNGTDHRTHAEQGDAIPAYLRWRNARATPKLNFAPGWVIWTWTSYQNKVA